MRLGLLGLGGQPVIVAPAHELPGALLYPVAALLFPHEYLKLFLLGDGGVVLDALYGHQGAVDIRHLEPLGLLFRLALPELLLIGLLLLL